MESQEKVSVWLDNLEEDCRPYSFFHGFMADVDEDFMEIDVVTEASN